MSTVSVKGQVTIPKAIREKLGLRPGTILELSAVEGKLVGVKKEQSDPISRWLGKGKLPGGIVRLTLPTAWPRFERHLSKDGS